MYIGNICYCKFIGYYNLIEIKVENGIGYIDKTTSKVVL